MKHYIFHVIHTIFYWCIKEKDQKLLYKNKKTLFNANNTSNSYSILNRLLCCSEISNQNAWMIFVPHIFYNKRQRKTDFILCSNFYLIQIIVNLLHKLLYNKQNLTYFFDKSFDISALN